jgi:hypothetical protein
MGLPPFVRSVLGGSRFPQLVGQELPEPSLPVPVKVEPVEVVDSAKKVKPKAKKAPKPTKP